MLNFLKKRKNRVSIILNPKRDSIENKVAEFDSKFGFMVEQGYLSETVYFEFRKYYSLGLIDM